MQITFDPAKNLRNVAERGLSFELVEQFDFSTAKIWQDTRKAYHEVRFNATGYLGDRLHCLCFTPVDGGIRVISFRKANARERGQYEKA